MYGGIASDAVEAVLAAPTGVVVDSMPRHGGADIPLVAPADGRAWTTIAGGSRADAGDAAASARRALPSWSRTDTATRAAILHGIADDLDAAADSGWAELVSSETGKRLAEARGEISFSATYFRTFADMIADGDDEFVVVRPGGVEHRVRSQALGVVALLTPWNFPVSIPARKLAAALAAGCTVLFKPSELAPLSSMVLVTVMNRHLEPGVVNTVLGTPSEVSDLWLADEGVRGVSFTGSTRVGRIIAGAASQQFKRQVLELGGCSPFIVMEDADIQLAVETLLVAKYRNNGQSCIAANQIMVARGIAESFTDAFVAASGDLTVGDPHDPATDIGPLAPAGDPWRLAELVDQARVRGAVVAGGQRDQDRSGHWCRPAVVMNLPATDPVATREIFGPVAAISTFDHVDEAISAHSETGYGLAGYVCGTDLDAAEAVARKLDVGIIGINNGAPNHPSVPFGGRGLSGLGYEGGLAGLREFQVLQTLTTSRMDR